MHALAAACPPLEANSCYAYLLLCSHFADTCILARDADGPVGYIAGYRLPARLDTLFIWQIGVHPRARGAGLGPAMIDALLAGPGADGVRHLETTVSPGNAASMKLFRGYARRAGLSLAEHPFLEPSHFGGETHEAEHLLRMGPFPPRLRAAQHGGN
jgi:L-2,4-diaminobutyric acid acetyltransferase